MASNGERSSESWPSNKRLINGDYHPVNSGGFGGGLASKQGRPNRYDNTMQNDSSEQWKPRRNNNSKWVEESQSPQPLLAEHQQFHSHPPATEFDEAETLEQHNYVYSSMSEAPMDLEQARLQAQHFFNNPNDVCGEEYGHQSHGHSSAPFEHHHNMMEDRSSSTGVEFATPPGSCRKRPHEGSGGGSSSQLSTRTAHTPTPPVPSAPKMMRFALVSQSAAPASAGVTTAVSTSASSRYEGHVEWMPSPLEKEIQYAVVEMRQELAFIDTLDPQTVGVNLHNSKRLLIAECKKLEESSNPEWLQVDMLRPIKLSRQVMIPMHRYPTVNMVGRILGVRGATLTKICKKFKCFISILGAHSTKDRKMEIEMLNSGDPRYSHYASPLHVRIDVIAAPHIATMRMGGLLNLFHKILTPGYTDFDLEEFLADVDLYGENKYNRFKEKNAPTKYELEALEYEEEFERELIEDEHQYTIPRNGGLHQQQQHFNQGGAKRPSQSIGNVCHFGPPSHGNHVFDCHNCTKVEIEEEEGEEEEFIPPDYEHDRQWQRGPQHSSFVQVRHPYNNSANVQIRRSHNDSSGHHHPNITNYNGRGRGRGRGGGFVPRAMLRRDVQQQIPVEASSSENIF